MVADVLKDIGELIHLRLHNGIHSYFDFGVFEVRTSENTLLQIALCIR